MVEEPDQAEPVEEPELDELPAEYPLRRPRTYAYCLAIGLGSTMPCVWASCRHNLLVDELMGETHGEDVDLRTVETCSLAVAGRGPHSTARAMPALTGLAESTAEEVLRRGLAKTMAALGLDEYTRVQHGQLRFIRPKQRVLRPSKRDLDGICALVEALFKRGLPPLNAPPVRHLSPAEVGRLYGSSRVHPAYGQPRQAGALGGAAAAPAGQEAETRKETAAPAARDSNRQDER